MLFKKNIENLAAFGGGKIYCQNIDFKKIVFNSKDIKKGDVFLPLKGQNHDAHKFISEAYDLGAACVISENKIDNKNHILVKNTNAFLENIAKKQRELFEGLVIGITGSNGKTTTKETLTKYFREKLKQDDVYKSYGNFNNFFGLCFSLLELSPHHKVGFFEIGTSNSGEISNLANILKMNLSIITNIGNAHLEGLKNIDGVADEKSDIFVFTKEGGYCLGDIPKKYLNLVRDKSSGKKRIFISDNNPKELMKTAIMKINDLLSLEYLPKEVDRFLDKKIDVPGRFEIKKSKSRALIIDDSYNANPDSFSYAFKKIKNLDLAKISSGEKDSKYQKKICVMGKMGELGEKSEDMHRYILKEASSIFDVVLAIDFKVNLKASNIFFYKREKVDSYLEEYLDEDVLIFFKGSRSVKMENIIKNLT